MLPFVSSSISKCFHLHTTSYCWVPGLPGSITLRSTRHSDSSPSTFPPPPTHKTPCFGSLLVQGVFAQSPKFREAPQKADSNPPKSLGLFWGRGLLPFVKCAPYTRHYDIYSLWRILWKLWACYCKPCHPMARRGSSTPGNMNPRWGVLHWSSGLKIPLIINPLWGA